MNKVIIITRSIEKEYYNPDYKIGRIKKDQLSKGLFPVYMAFLDNIFRVNPLSPWHTKTQLIPDSNALVKDYELIPKKPKVCDIAPIYNKFSYDQSEIYLFYFDQTHMKNVIDLGQFLSVICHDCGISLSDKTPEDNILYIHDDEWGDTGEKLLLWGHGVDDYDITDRNHKLLDALKDKFIFIAMFTHEDIPGSHYKHILNCEFGKFSTVDKLERIETTHSSSFKKLYDECKKIILEK